MNFLINFKDKLFCQNNSVLNFLLIDLQYKYIHIKKFKNNQNELITFNFFFFYKIKLLKLFFLFFSKNNINKIVFSTIKNKIFILGLNILNINYKNFFFNQNKSIFNISNKQIIDKNFSKDASFEKSKKNIKNIKISFLYYLKLVKKYINTNNADRVFIFLLKNKNFTFFFNLLFFFKYLIKELNISFFFINFYLNKNLKFKKIKSIKKRLLKKYVSNIQVY